MVIPEPDDEWLLRWQESPTDDAVGAPILSFEQDVPSEERNPLRYRTAREVAEITSDEVEFAAAYLAFGAITEFDGKPKAAGKTTYLLAMIGAILDGRPFLGKPTTAGPVVMLTEQPLSSLKAAIVRAQLTDRDDLTLLSWADAAGRPWADIVASAAAKCREIGARILVVDTLPQFAGLRGDAENNAGDALEAVEPLQLLAAEGFAVGVSRHDRKSGGEVGESARGSGAFTGAVDIVVSIGRDARDPRPTMRRLGCLSRFSETPPDLVIEWIDGRYVVIGTTEEAMAQARRGRLLEALPEDGQGMRVEDLAELLGDKAKAVRELLNDLYAGGLVGRTGGGVKGDPFLWSRPGPIPSVLPFVPLRETNERKETGPFEVVDLAVEDDYPSSAWRLDDEGA